MLRGIVPLFAQLSGVAQGCLASGLLFAVASGAPWRILCGAILRHGLPRAEATDVAAADVEGAAGLAMHPMKTAGCSSAAAAIQGRLKRAAPGVPGVAIVPRALGFHIGPQASGSHSRSGSDGSRTCTAAR